MDKQLLKIGVTVDNVIFGFHEKDLEVLLIKGGSSPHPDLWALPGDYVHYEEELEEAAHRVLRELTGLQGVFLEQVKAFGGVHRHPNGRVVTTAFLSLVQVANTEIYPSNWATDVKWQKITDVGTLAFDHNEILNESLAHLKKQVRSRPIGFELLPTKFTLTELQNLYESTLGIELDKRNFRKKILSEDILLTLSERQEGVAHRPARLYQFDQIRYEKLAKEGFEFF